MIKLLYLLLLIPSIAFGGAATIGGVSVTDIDTLGGVAIEDIDTFGGVTVGVRPGGTYNFYLDFEGHREDKIAREVLNNLEQKSLFLKILGSYPKAR